MPAVRQWSGGWPLPAALDDLSQVIAGTTDPDLRARLETSPTAILRARYRNSPAEPELLEPQQVYEITLDLSVTSNVFLPGHRIRLEISSSNFPPR